MKHSKTGCGTTPGTIITIEITARDPKLGVAPLIEQYWQLKSLHVFQSNQSMNETEYALDYALD